MVGLEKYLQDLSAARQAGGLPETSGYPALSNLLNEVGVKLRPRVRAIIHVSNSGAGIPDGGFFTPDQLRENPDESSLFELQPSRGVLEVKAPSDELSTVAESDQVLRYLRHYGQILLTNYKDFALWHWENSSPRLGETYTLAASESTFWQRAASPRVTAEADDGRLLDYLRRVLLSLAPLSEPKVLAAFLASYAREARARVGEAPLDALATVRTTLEEALGIQFTDERGRHFFQSTFIQTLFYGVFSAWVLWHEENPGRRDRFRWRESHFSIGLPVLRKLFQLVSDPQQLRARGLEQVLDWTGDTLNRVDRHAFFARFELGHAVQYFYEPFLAEFDSELRTQFGVWFTPPDVVKYMVQGVDRALREDLDIASGLADRRVYVLDPCCGTGTYLFEVLRRILRTGEGRFRRRPSGSAGNASSP
jgi:N-6 DNA Methylase